MHRKPLKTWLPFRLAALVAPLIAAWPQRAQAETWVPTAAGTAYQWGTGSNWSPATVPNSAAAVANLNNDIAGAQTVNLATGTAANRTVNDLNLGDSNGTHAFTIASGVAGSTLIFAGTNPSLDIAGGNITNVISAPIRFDADTVIRSQTTASNTLSGGLTDGGVARTITFNNDTNGTARAAASLEGQFSIATTAATFAAGTTTSVNDVRVNLAIANGLGAAATNTITVGGAGQLFVTAGSHTNNLILNSSGWVETAAVGNNGGNLGSLRIENSTISGSVTLQQNSIISVNANNTGTLSGAISGAFDITKVGGTGTANQGVLLLSGNNSSWSGKLSVDRGTVRVNNANALGTGTQVTVNGNSVPTGGAGAFGATLELAGGFTYGAGKNLTLISGSLANNHRASLVNQAGSNTWAGTITLDSAEAGGSLSQITNNTASTTLTLSGNISGTGASYPGLFFLRGTSAGSVASTAVLNMPNTDLGKTDGGKWTISSTGNNWKNTIAADGILAIGATDALDTGANLTVGQGSGTTGQVDLGGFNQTVAAFSSDSASTSAGLILRNTSTTAASTLTFTTTGNDTFKGTLSNETGGGLSLVKNGSGTFTLNSTTPSVAVSAWTAGSISANAGTLNLGGTVLLGGAANTIAVADGAKLGGEGNFGGSATLGTTTGTSLIIDGGTASALKIGGTLTLNGSTAVELTGAAPVSGALRVVDVPATPGGAGLASFVAPAGFRSPAFVFNTDHVEMTYGTKALTWNNQSADSLWNLATSVNWQDSTPANSDFYNGDSVAFTDLPGANQTVSVAGRQNAASVLLDNSTAVQYTFTNGGSGVIDTGITKQNTGKAIIAFDNATTQPVTITAGTLQFGNGGTTGNSGTGTITNSGTLAYNYGAAGNVTIAAPITNNATGVVDVAGAGTVNFAAAIANAGSITTGGTSTVNFTGAIANAGSITTGGTSVVNGNSVISGAGTVTVGTGSTLNLTRVNTYTGLTTVQSGGTLAMDYATISIPVANTVQIDAGGLVKATRTDAGYTFGPVLTGSGTLELNAHTIAGGTAAHTVALGASNTAFTGTIRLESPVTGTYRLNPAGQSTVGSANIIVKDGAQLYAATALTNDVTITGEGYADALGKIGALRVDGTTTYSGNITIDGSAKVGSNGGTATLSGNISGGNLLVGAYNGGSTFILTGTNTYGDTAVNGASIAATPAPSRRLNIGAGGTTGTLGTGVVTINGDTANGVLGFDRSDGYTLAASQTITAVGTNLDRTFVDFDTKGTGFNNNGNTIDLGSPAVGGSLRAGQSRPDTVTTLNGTVEGKLLSIGGQISVNTSNAVVNLGATASVSVNDIRLALGGSSTASTNSAGATLNIANGAVVSAANTFWLGETAGGTASVNQTGGTVTVGSQMRVGHWGSHTSTYTIDSGSLSVTAAPTAFPHTAGAAEVNGGIYVGVDGTGVFNHNGGTVSTGFVVLDNRGDSTGTDTYSLKGGTLELTSSHGIVSRNASAAFNLDGGTIKAMTDTRLDSSKITVASASTLATNGRAVSVLAPLAGTAQLKITDAGRVVTTDSATAGFSGGGSFGAVALDIASASTVDANRTGTDTWSGVITGSGSIEKNSTGTLILTGTSPLYSGTVDVNDGILQVDGTLGGTVDLDSGGILQGTGTVGTLNIAGGVLAPGTSPGILSTGSVTTTGGVLGTGVQIEIGGLTAGTDYDQIQTTGTLTLNGGVLSVSLINSFTPAVGDTFYMWLNDGTDLIGGTPGIFTGLAEGASIPAPAGSFTISYVANGDGGAVGNDVSLTYVPEPGTGILLLLAGSGFLRRRRRA